MRHSIVTLTILLTTAPALAAADLPRLASIPAQDVVLGGRPDEPGYSPRELRYRVVLSRFAIGTTEVTNAQFCDFLNDAGNVAHLTVPAIAIHESGGIRRAGERFVPADGRAAHPVTRVTWQGARAYCAWLSRRTGVLHDLPTAAQWEAAARAGAATAWTWGDRDDPARHTTRGSDGAVAVASYAPNAYGLYDTTGNVWEWVLDCFDPDAHRYAPLRDPVRFERDCLAPEIRGGSFLDGSDSARPAFRANYWWAPQIDGIGFRVAASGGAQ